MSSLGKYEQIRHKKATEWLYHFWGARSFLTARHCVWCCTQHHQGNLQTVAEKPALTPCWNSFFDLLFIVLAIMSIHNGLHHRTLLLCLIVKLKCLCSAHRQLTWPYPPVNGCDKEEINTFLPQACHSWRCFGRLVAFSTLFPHHLSLSILPF